MDRTLLKTLYVIAASLGLAFIFNFLFFEKVPGVSLLIFAVIFLGAVFFVGAHQHISFRKTWWLALLICFFAAMPSIRANEFVTFLNLCAIFGLLMVLANLFAGTPAVIMRLRDYIILMTLVPLRMLGRAVSTVTLIGQIHSSVQHRDVWLRISKGVIMAVPVLIIFGVLFSQADLAFSQFVKGFVDITISERTIQYCVVLLIVFVAALSYLSYIFSPKHAKSESVHTESETGAQSGKGIEVLVFLGLIAMLFFIFIGFQITYLFGGEANIINAGFTYAEYARRGFWELLAVAMLSLVVLLASEKYAGVASKRDNRFLIPALILIGEVGIIIASALKRLSLYVDAYGMTEQRFYAAGFITLLAVLCILLAITFIQTRKEQFFAFGALLSVAAFVIALNLISPDSFIARYNIERYNRTGTIDAGYVGMLSADAEHWKIELYKRLEGGDKNLLRELLQKQEDRLQKHSAVWQSANLSRARALKLLQEL